MIKVTLNGLNTLGVPTPGLNGIPFATIFEDFIEQFPNPPREPILYANREGFRLFQRAMADYAMEYLRT